MEHTGSTRIEKSGEKQLVSHRFLKLCNSLRQQLADQYTQNTKQDADTCIQNTKGGTLLLERHA